MRVKTYSGKLNACAQTALVFSFLLAPTVATAESFPHERSIASRSQPAEVADEIERLMFRLQVAKKPLPAWVLDIALRAYKTYKTYKNGERIEEAQRVAVAALEAVDDIRRQVEAGRNISEYEWKLARELLNSHSHRIDDISAHLGSLERRINELEAVHTRVDKTPR